MSNLSGSLKEVVDLTQTDHCPPKIHCIGRNRKRKTLHLNDLEPSPVAATHGPALICTARLGPRPTTSYKPTDTTLSTSPKGQPQRTAHAHEQNYPQNRRDRHLG